MKLPDEPIVVSHPFPRHSDDVFTKACILRLRPKAQFIESRDPAVIATADVAIDVGLVYDPERFRFDHHQQDAPVRPDGSPYSSLGLFWKHFGTEICEGDEGAAAYVDETFIRTIDASDNGIPTHMKVEGYRNIDIASIIGLFNPSWAEGDDTRSADLQIAVAAAILDRVLIKVKHKKMAEEEVKEAVAKEEAGIIVLKRFLPWQDYVVDLSNTARVVVFPAQDGGFNVQAVPAELGNRAAGNRAQLPTQEDAYKILQDDLKFVHKGRFIGGAKTFDGAMTLAKMSV